MSNNYLTNHAASARSRDLRLLNLSNKFRVLQNFDKSEKMTKKKGDRMYPTARELSARVESSTTGMATKRKGVLRRKITSHKTI